MGRIIGACAAFFAGTIVAAIAQNRLDDKIIARGWMEHRGTVYVIRPAKVTETTP